MTDHPVTRLCRHQADRIHYRDRDLVGDLLGRVGFVEVMFAQVLGRVPNTDETALIDAVLVTLMEHGMTPSAITARLIYMSAPESLQGAVAAGLQGVGGQFIGTMEDCGRLLTDIARQGPDRAAAIVAEHRAAGRPVPGFGHHLHKPDDPRAVALLALARERGVAGAFQDALERLAGAVDALGGRHVTINATGAVAAILGDLGVPAAAMRGFAVVARAAGLVAHVLEEQEHPTGRFIWDLVDKAIPFAE